MTSEEEMKSNLIFIQFTIFVGPGRGKYAFVFDHLVLSQQVALCKSYCYLFSPGGDPIAKLSPSWSQRWTRRVTMSAGFKQTQTFVTPE